MYTIIVIKEKYKLLFKSRMQNLIIISFTSHVALVKIDKIDKI
jgi:hypothetical protein